MSSSLQRMGGRLAGFIGRHLFRFRNRVMIVAVPGILLTVVVCSIVCVMTQQTMIRDEAFKRAEVVSELISRIAVKPLNQNSMGRMTETVQLLEDMRSVASVSLYDDHGLLMSGAENEEDRRHSWPRRFEMTVFEDRDHYDIYTPVFPGKTAGQELQKGGFITDAQKDPLGWIRIAFLKRYIREDRMHVVVRGLLAAFVFTVCSSVIVFILYGFAFRSLEQISSEVRSIRIKHYPELDTKSNGGIADIATEFNRMSRAINKREEMLVVRARFSQFSADVGIALTESTDLGEMARKCSDICCSYTKSICAGIWLFDSDDNMLRLKTSVGKYEGHPFPSEVVAVGEGSAGRVAYMMVPFATMEPLRIFWFHNHEFMSRNGVRFYAGYPIIAESRLLGVLELYSREPFCWDLMNMLDTLCEEMAVGFERKIIEERMKKSLEEKEVLLREIHHRVKNNMQVISSLLNLQSGTIVDPGYREMFDESKNRIRAMALVHEKLYQTQDIARIDISDYIASLANGLFMFYGISASLVTLSIDAEDIVLGIDTAIPCGLIINELLTNALKYAFPGNREGEIRITIRKDEFQEGGEPMYTLTVRDNGAGLPPEFNFREAKSLGLLLVSSLTEHQLQGTLTVEQKQGTAFHIHFRDAAYRKKV